MTQAEREELILSLAPRVRAAVDRVFRAMPTMVGREDMLNEAWIGAIQAVDRFEPERGLKLSTLAERRIRGQILDYLRSMDRLKRKHRRKVRDGQAIAPRVLELGDRDFLDPRGSRALQCLEDRRDTRLILCRAKLTPRQRRVLSRHYWGSALDKDIAQEMGVSTGRISQLRTAIIAKLRAVLVSV